MAERMGAPRAAVLKRAGLSAERLIDPSSRVSLAEEMDIWDAIKSETGREDIGLVCGLNFPIQATGLLGYVVMNSPDMATAIEKSAVYQKLIGDSMGARVEADEHYFTVYIEMWTEWQEGLRFTQDVTLGAYFSWVEKNTVSAVKPVRVGLHYEEPANAADYTKAFGPAPVAFGVAESYLVYNAKDIHTPILSQNSEMFEHFEKQVKALYLELEGGETVVDQTRKLILKHMDGQAPGVEKIAMELAMSVRSLQKALKEEGSSYQKLLNAVRKELAVDYLKKDQFNLSEIAFLLGFSELTVFSRSFKKWTGYSPSNYPMT